MEDLENRLVDRAVEWLRERLPATWGVQLDVDSASIDNTGDSEIRITGPQSYTPILVEAKTRLSPRDVDRLMGGLSQRLKKAVRMPILIVSPWLSPRTQAALSEAGLNFLDLTGNALIRIDNPAIYISTVGAMRDPSPTPTGQLRLNGPKAGRLMRWLVDVRPPYGVRELAAATQLSPSYVSRVLEALDEEQLIERLPRNQTVAAVDIAGIVRRWTDNYSVLRSNEAARFVGPRGAAAAFAEIGTIKRPFAVTGSFAAVRRAPVAAPALLAVYTDTPAEIAAGLDLIPADDGVNVVLLTPADPVVWSRTLTDGDITYVADSQVVVDCLSGNGRMPAEGEALLEWMLSNEDQWRVDSLTVPGLT